MSRKKRGKKDDCNKGKRKAGRLCVPPCVCLRSSTYIFPGGNALQRSSRSSPSSNSKRGSIGSMYRLPVSFRSSFQIDLLKRAAVPAVSPAVCSPAAPKPAASVPSFFFGMSFALICEASRIICSCLAASRSAFSSSL